MASRRFWAELKSSEFAALDPNSTVAILPVAATEQHGPHLPVLTDTAIGEGLIKTVLARLPDDLGVLVLPTQTIGKSDEHLRSPGTITHSADNLVRINSFVVGREHLKGYMSVRDLYIADPPPASTLMIVSGFSRPEFLVEVEVIAAAP